MEKQLREKAEKKVAAKVTFYQSAVVFSCVSILLLILSVYFPGIAIWLSLPILVFVMVLGLLAISTFGLPNASGLSDDWEEDEIEKEMNKLRRRKKVQLPPLKDLSETEVLELKELERLQEKWDLDGDYV
jgi:hypothetical protein